MKKSNLKALNLNKKAISILSDSVKGGCPLPTHSVRQCPSDSICPPGIYCY